MSAGNDFESLAALPEDVQAAVDKFRSAWDKGSAPRLDEYLPLEPSRRRAVLIELIHVDLERRLERGEAVRLESYLQRFAELVQEPEEMASLVAAEYLHRRRQEQQVTPQEYLQRFPQWQKEIGTRLTPEEAGATITVAGSESPASLSGSSPVTATPSTVAELAELLRRFLKETHFSKMERELRPRCARPADLLRELVRWGWLTPFQAQSIQRGQGDDLVLGPYLLLEPLGAGGMGQVFKARHRLMNRLAALKLIRREARSSGSTDRFLREMEAAAQLSHPNIVAAYDAEQVGSRLYLAMEYIEGVDLSRLLKAQGALPHHRAADYTRQAALALQHAHERGLIHRDIKPSNLMVTGERARRDPADTGDADAKRPQAVPLTSLTHQIKLLDLGLARLQDDSDNARCRLTQLGTIMGTPDYIAPEQALESAHADIRSDIYSLGCTLYHLLTGQAPFPGGSAEVKLLAHCQKEPTPVEQLRPGIPAALGQVVRKMMAKKPDERYQTPAEVAAALVPFCGVSAKAPRPMKPRSSLKTPPSGSLPARPVAKARSGPNRAVRPGTPARRPQPAPEPSRGRPWLVGIMVLGLLLAAAAPVVIIWYNWASETDVVAKPPADRPADPLPPGPGSSKPLAAQASNPLDSLTAAAIPLELRFTGQPKEVVGMLGDGRVAHKSPIKALAVSPNGHWLASADYPALRLSKADTLRETWSAPTKWTKDLREILALAFSPDGTMLAGGHPLRFWDAANGKQLWEAKDDKDQNHTVAFLPGGRKLLTSGNKTPVRLWEWDPQKKEARLVKVFDNNADNFPRFAVAPDGSSLLSVQKEGKGHHPAWFDAATGKFLRKAQPGLKMRITCAAFAPDGLRAAGGDFAGHVAVWEVASGKKQISMVGDGGQVIALGFLPGGQRLLSVHHKGDVYLWDTSSDQPLWHVKAALGLVYDAVLLDLGSKVAVTDARTIRVFDTATGKEVQPQAPHEGPLSCVTFCPDDKHLLAATSGAVRLWDLTTLQEVYRLGTKSSTSRLAVSADGQRAAATGAEPLAWDLKSGKKLWDLPKCARKALTFLPDGKALLLVLEDDSLNAWDASAGLPAAKKRFDGAKVPSPGNLALSLDGTLAVTTSIDHTGTAPGGIAFWDAKAGKLRDSWAFPDEGFGMVALSPDQRYLYGAREKEGAVWVWDRQKNAKDQPIRKLELKGTVGAMALSADGSTLITWSAPGTLTRWQVPEGVPKQEWKLSEVVPQKEWLATSIPLVDAPQILDISPDGRYLAAGRVDGRILLMRLDAVP